MRASWIVMAALVSACLQAGDVVCNDGRVCPADYTCTATGCASAEQLKVCAGIADDTSCETTAGPGRCFDGACVVAFCGNGKLEPGEVCDDGNQLGRDGCNGTCSSDESCGNGIVELAEECDSADAACGSTCKIVRCGNGIVEGGETCDDGNNAANDGCSPLCNSDETCGNATLDYFSGEQCDDANHRSFDGCNALCQAEKIAWIPNDGATTTPPALNEAVAYDTERRRLVIFGGVTNAIAQGDTWELEGSTWIKRVLVTNPPPRYGAAMAYDWKRGRIVMFGGNTNGGYDNGTWEFDGIAWRDASTVNRPLGRIGHQLVYDSARERIVLFGGTSGAGLLNDTWEYDGSNWTQTVADFGKILLKN